MIVIDTSTLVDCFTGELCSFNQLRELVFRGEKPALPTIVLYEWWRGPRLEEELSAQRAFFRQPGQYRLGLRTR